MEDTLFYEEEDIDLTDYIPDDGTTEIFFHNGEICISPRSPTSKKFLPADNISSKMEHHTKYSSTQEKINVKADNSHLEKKHKKILSKLAESNEIPRKSQKIDSSSKVTEKPEKRKNRHSEKKRVSKSDKDKGSSEKLNKSDHNEIGKYKFEKSITENSKKPEKSKKPRSRRNSHPIPCTQPEKLVEQKLIDNNKNIKKSNIFTEKNRSDKRKTIHNPSIKVKSIYEINLENEDKIKNTSHKKRNSKVESSNNNKSHNKIPLFKSSENPKQQKSSENNNIKFIEEQNITPEKKYDPITRIKKRAHRRSVPLETTLAEKKKLITKPNERAEFNFTEQSSDYTTSKSIKRSKSSDSLNTGNSQNTKEVEHKSLQNNIDTINRKEDSKNSDSPKNSVKETENPELLRYRLGMPSRSSSVSVVSLMHSPSAKNTLSKIQAQAKMRQHVVTEIVTTEISFLESLNFLILNLIRPVENAKIMTEEEFSYVFSNLYQIYERHTQFLEIIKPKIQNWTPKSTIGKEFHNNVAIVEVYKPYLLNYNVANLSLEQLLKKYPNLSSYLNSFDEQSTKLNGYHVPDILIMPIQRIPRYILLLEQLLKFSFRGTYEAQYLEEAIKIITTNLKAINSQIDPTQLPNMEKVVQTRNSFLNCTEQKFPTNLKRKFLKKGKLSVSKISNTDKKKLVGKKLVTLAHDDFIVLCKIKKEKKDDLKKFEIIESIPCSVVQTWTLLKKKEFKLQMKGEEWTFEAKSEEEAIDWVTILQQIKK